jgi:hypothetical protein
MICQAIIIVQLMSTALADISPGPFYKEDCTVDKKQQEGTTCDTCSNGMNTIDTADIDEGHCSVKFEGTDYEYVCSTTGVSYWSEVWCDGPPKERGCSSIGMVAGMAPLLLLSIAAIRWRKEE